MKTRSGFVSNSSSSSFVISANNGIFKTVVDIALYMIPKRGWEDDEKVVYNIHRQIELGMSPNHPISFRSCNYDTFICRRENGEFYVSTCNNHDWGFTACNNSSWECIAGVSMSPDDDEESFILYEMPYLFKYYNATYGVTGYQYGILKDGYFRSELCKDCNTDLWTCFDSGIPFCPQCGKKLSKTDPFEAWWSLNKKHIATSASPSSIEDMIKNIARQAYEAGTIHTIKKG